MTDVNGDPLANVDPADRAAVLLLSLGEEAAAEILRHMGPKEVQRIGSAMAQLKNVTREQVEAVMRDFMGVVKDFTSLGIGSENYIRKMLVNALGEDKARGLIDRILVGGGSTGLDALKWMEPRAIADIIRFEHPQIQAIVTAYLDSDQAAAVLNLLDERARLEVVLRISALETVQPHAMKELNTILERQFLSQKSTSSTSLGGLKCAADIMNYLDTETEQAIMESISELDEDLALDIQDMMFVFENLADTDDRGIQAILREVSSDSLIIALKGADDTVKDKIFGNMSKRAAELLKDDLEAKGPVKLSEVETAQKEILAVARRMADAGEIVLGGRGSDDMV